MSFLSNIGAMLPAAYAGFNKGVDDVTARQQREADAKHQEEQRARARAMAPLEDEARTSRLKTLLDQDKTAGIKGGIERTILEEQEKNLPQQLTDARIAQELASAKTASDATTSLLSIGGQAAASGDTVGLNKVFGHLIKAGLVQRPDGQKLEPPVSSAIVEAPKGSLDFVGQPIEGRAIQATMPDGTKHYVSTKFMDDAYKRQVQAADAASVKMIKPGERAFVPRTGQVIAEGQPRVTSQGYYDPETGEFVPARPGASGASGSRSGAGGRAPEDVSKQAQDALEFLTKSDEFKALTTSQVASAQLFTERAVAFGVTPREAALVGMEVAKDPTKIAPDVDARTGQWSGVYRNPSIAGGRPFNLAPNFATTQEVAKREGGELVLKDAAGKVLDAQGAIIAPGNPQAQAAIRDQFLKAANDPAERAKMLEVASRGGPQEVAALNRKLDLIQAYGPKPKKDDSSSGRNRLSVGGMGGPESYSPKPGTPPSIQERMRERGAKEAEDSARKAEVAREKKVKQDAADADGRKSVEWITPGAIKVLSGSEARKLRNGTEWMYLDSDLRRLLTIQSGRSD